MNTKHIIKELQKNKIIFKDLLENLTEDLYLWKSNPEKWCLLEIICHLYDEEREDFRARVIHVLGNSELPVDSLDPISWVTAREYIKQDYNAVLTNFLIERNSSIEWLNRLDKPRWNNVYKHPKLGNLTAGMFFANWLAHDYLHIRQIIKLKYEYLKIYTKENLSYAGEW